MINRIKKVIEQKGISELRPSPEILDRMGVSVKTWNKWIEGKTDPELWQLEIVAEFLGCEMAELIERKNERAAT
jgi:transcriptional regulator with XRE-family HTH domain